MGEGGGKGGGQGREAGEEGVASSKSRRVTLSLRFVTLSLRSVTDCDALEARYFACRLAAVDLVSVVEAIALATASAIIAASSDAVNVIVASDISLKRNRLDHPSP